MELPFVRRWTVLFHTVMTATNASTASHAPEHELDAPPWRRVESTLMAAASGIRTVFDERLDPLGLTLSTASLLAYVCEFGPVTQTRAAEHNGTGRAVTGTYVDKLEACGLLARQPDPNDRRVWLLVATDAGRAKASEVAEVDEVLRAELRDGISRDDRQALAGLLVRLQRNIDRATNTSSATTTSEKATPA